MTRQKNRPSLYLEGGALLFNRVLIPGRLLEPEKITARAIARAEVLMGCRAAGIAPHDLAAGTDFLRILEKETGLRWLSANLVEPGNGKPIFTPFLITEIGTLRIGVAGLSGPPPARVEPSGSWKVADWRKILPSLIQTLEEETDMIILLSSYPPGENEKIARSFDTIHILLQAGHGTSNMRPKKINNTLILRTGSRGKYLGMLEINWNSSKKWGRSLNEQIRETTRQQDRISWYIGRMKKRYPAETLTTNRRYQELTGQLRKTEEKLRELKQKMTQGGQEPCSFTNRFIALKPEIPPDPGIQEIVDQARREANRLNLEIARSERRRLKEKKNLSPQAQALRSLSGWKTCRTCHRLQTSFWQQTGHATAWQTLQKKNQEHNPSCQKCHVTLPSYALNPDLTREILVRMDTELKTVGCEACHGPSRGHADAPDKFNPNLPTEATCRQCHQGDHDDTFIFADKVMRIRCPATKNP
ncbi:UshA-like (seleno)protein [Desulfolithobacter sp.]